MFQRRKIRMFKFIDVLLFNFIDVLGASIACSIQFPKKYCPAFCMEMIVLSAFVKVIKFSSCMFVRVQLDNAGVRKHRLRGLNKQLKSDWRFRLRHQKPVHADINHAFNYDSTAAYDPKCVVSASLCGSSHAHSVVCLSGDKAWRRSE